MIPDLFVHPALLFMISACFMPVFKKIRILPFVLLAVPVFAFIQLYAMPGDGIYGSVSYLNMTLVFENAGRLSFLFLHMFILISFIISIYCLHIKKTCELSASFFLIGGSLGVVSAGDFLTLYIFWNLMMFSSAFLIWFRKNKGSLSSGYRFLLMQIAGSLVLLAGIILKYQLSGSLVLIKSFSIHADLSDYLIMTGFLMNAAMPPLHTWLTDSYSEATVSGTIALSVFTVKTAVFILMRIFPGFEILMVIGACMTLYGASFALVENDMRKLLAYLLISQAGFMLCGIGTGTLIALKGVLFHAYVHTFFSSLLFMGTGAVLDMTGTSKLTALGGLYRYMPVTLVFTLIGGACISGFPMTGSFISYSMIITETGEISVTLMLILTLALVGTFLSAGIKLPYAIWFGRDCGLHVKEPGFSMRTGMFLAALLCLILGFQPGYDYIFSLYDNPMTHDPYNSYQVSKTLQIVGFSGFGYFLLRNHMNSEDRITLDSDWFYRMKICILIDKLKETGAGLLRKVEFIYKKIITLLTTGISSALFWFDKEGIDWMMNGSARSVSEAGRQLKDMQSGNVHQYIGYTLVILIIMLIILTLKYVI